MTAPKGNVTSCSSGEGGCEKDGDYQTRLTYWPTCELKSRTLPYDVDQAGSHDLHVDYEIDDVGDPSIVTDAGGDAVSNTFLDSGELESTTRPSWWKLDGGKLSEKSPSEMGGDDGTPSTEKPSAQGEGDFGAVNRAEHPDLMPRAGLTQFGYDDNLQLNKVTDAANKPVDITYDPTGRMTRMLRPIDPNHDMDEQTAYDFNGNVRRRTVPLADYDAISTLGYDQFDRQVRDAEPGSSADDSAVDVSKQGYDANGNVTSLVSPRDDLTTTRAYDDVDRLITETNPAGEATHKGYDANGNVNWDATPKFDDPDPSSQPADYVTSYEHNFDDELASKTQKIKTSGTTAAAHDRHWAYDYDVNGNKIATTAPGAASEPVLADVPQLTTQSFDGLDRLMSQTTSASDEAVTNQKRTKLWEYDPDGALRRVVNPAGVDYGADGTPRAKFTYLNDFEVSAEPEASKNATVFEHGESLDPTLTTGMRLPWGSRDAEDEKEWEQDFHYDGRGRLDRLDPAYDIAAHSSAPDAAKTTYTHYDNGWIESSTDDRTHMDYSYDARGDQVLWETHKAGDASLGRRIARSYYPSGLLKTRVGTESSSTGGGEGDRSYSYLWTADHLLKKDSDSRADSGQSRTTNYSYDDASRTKDVDEAPLNMADEMRRGKDTRFGYDVNGNVKTRKTDGHIDAVNAYVGGKTTTFMYDSVDREANAEVLASDGRLRNTTTTYWDSGDRKSREVMRPPTADGGPQFSTLTRTYFNRSGKLSRMDRHRTGDPDDDFAKNQSYTYGVNGNRTKDERGTHEFNARDQLVHTTKGDIQTGYTLDGSGAVQTKTRSGDDDHEKNTQTKYNYGDDNRWLDSVDWT